MEQVNTPNDDPTVKPSDDEICNQDWPEISRKNYPDSIMGERFRGPWIFPEDYEKLREKVLTFNFFEKPRD